MAAEKLKLISFLAQRCAPGASDRPNAQGATPLHMLLRDFPSRLQPDSAKADALRVLLKCGCDPGSRDPASGLTPLHSAVHLQPFVFDLLLKASKGEPKWEFKKCLVTFIGLKCLFEIQK